MVSLELRANSILSRPRIIEIRIVKREGVGKAEVTLVCDGKWGYACCLESGTGVVMGIGKVFWVARDETVAESRPREEVDCDGVLEGGLGGDRTLPRGH